MEKKKLQKVYSLVEEVKQDTKSLNSMIEVAKESKDTDTRKEMISDIKLTAADVSEKVANAAVLEKEVKEINVALKEKKKQADAQGQEGTTTTQ